MIIRNDALKNRGYTSESKEKDFEDCSMFNGMCMYRDRNGVIDNAGVNDVPRTWDSETGLYNNTKK